MSDLTETHKATETPAQEPAAKEAVIYEFSIYRYDPDKDKKPYMQDFELKLPAGKDMMLLDALLELKKQDETLAFRRSCGRGLWF